jgi:hypothetical protein
MGFFFCLFMIGCFEVTNFKATKNFISLQLQYDWYFAYNLNVGILGKYYNQSSMIKYYNQVCQIL